MVAMHTRLLLSISALPTLDAWAPAAMRGGISLVPLGATTTPSHAPHPLRLSAVEPAEDYVGARFDATLQQLLTDARSASVEQAVDVWLDRLDEHFIPSLGERVAAPLQEDNPDELSELMEVLSARSTERFARAKQQLETLLKAGEINKLDAQLVALVKRDELDGGFLYVLFRNMEDARRADDQTRLRLLQHLHTRVQEEMEKRADPGLALLHKLTRTEDEGVRGRILRHYLAPQTSVTLPDGTEMPLNPPAPATVPPLAFANAVEGALDKILAMAVDRAVIEATAEDIRGVAKEAHKVICEEYSQAEIEEFQDALTPVFARALPKRTASGEPKLHDSSS
ncbi:hypothetical protein AB1Y20_019093 [Prymnesium parvum]|uniref:Uncharacterized protein n=1 Tax=Prymnesium parvum TaxID=97485 RepID=A0AB34JUT0_PRYPA